MNWRTSPFPATEDEARSFTTTSDTRGDTHERLVVVLRTNIVTLDTHLDRPRIRLDTLSKGRSQPLLLQELDSLRLDHLITCDDEVLFALEDGEVSTGYGRRSRGG